LWQLGPLTFNLAGKPKIQGEYYLIVNSLYVFGLPKKVIEKQKAIFRLRSQAFADLQFWFGTQAGRPGKLLIG
jgi:hypothetical protein